VCLASLQRVKRFFLEVAIFFSLTKQRAAVFLNESCALFHEQSADVASFRRIFEAGLITLQLKTPKIHGRNLPRKSPKSFNYIFTQSESVSKGWLQRLVKGSLMGLL